jgi:hypothetical protein
MVPATGEDLVNDQVRINILRLSSKGTPEARDGTDVLEIGVKPELRTALPELVPPGVEHNVDITCVMYNRLVLSVFKQPELWPADRQIAVSPLSVSSRPSRPSCR